ncbi:MAG TPA: enoyl-CoA hydratase [Hyphomicrobiaceae bacterium]|nr:enoyl-CoA hydratase [Hyphomicrobiaceae bacterium]
MDGAAASGSTKGTGPLRSAHREGVLVLTLDAPKSRNALSEEMIAALHTAIDAASVDPATAAVVIQADGPAFCAGHDLKQMTARRADPDRGRAYFATLMNACAAMMQAIERSPKPVIAAVEGIATAAGCQLVATCDLAIAGPDARFGTPGVNIGLFCSTPMVALSRNVPRKKAMEMLLLGETLDAEGAALYGLVNKVVPADHVRAEALTWAQKIASKSPLTVAVGKEAFYRQIERGTADAYTMAAEVMVKNMLARDAEEGIGAFIEKRTPEWKGC